METGAIVFLAAFVVFVIVFIAFTSYSQENEELVCGMLCNMLIDNTEMENKPKCEITKSLPRPISNLPKREKTKEEIYFEDAYTLLNCKKAIVKNENEFNNDCA